MSLSASSLEVFCNELASRQPTPGGGGAAALAAALAAACAAMAARYTTGRKWSDRSQEAERLADGWDRLRTSCLEAIDADAAAYQVWRDSRSLDTAAQQAAAIGSRAVPRDLITAIAEASQAMRDFLPRCNPNLASDLHVALALCEGAARAAWATYLVNDPPEDESAEVAAALERCRRAAS